MADAYLGEIRMVGFQFAPRFWANADGQVLAINQNTALFSLYGTLYGGDGRSTFALPDLRGRVPIHTGNGPGLPYYQMGMAGGYPTVVLSEPEMPVHDHAVTVSAKAATADQAAPTDHYWAQLARGAAAYAADHDTTMAGDAVDVYRVDEETGEVEKNTRTDVKNVHVVPNPYKERADWDEATSNVNITGRKIYFVNLPPEATIRIYTIGGDLVQTLEHRYDLSPENDRTYWNLVSRNNQEVVSGVYIYHIESPVGEKIGRFVVIR